MPSAFVAGTGVQPITQLTNINQPSSAASSGGSNTSLGPNAFLQLLTTEMQHQDPTQPQDPTQSVTQLAQMSALQYQQQLSSNFATFQSNFGVMQAASLIGKQATCVVTDGSNNSSNVTGSISSISVQNGQPYFTMNDQAGKPIADGNGNPLLFSTTQIVGIGSGTSSGG